MKKFTKAHSAALQGNTEELRKLVDEKRSYLNAEDRKGNTPLHYATFARKLVTVIMLLEEGASVNVQNLNGNTPLHLTSNFKFVNWNAKLLVAALQKNGASINLQNKDGNTVLHMVSNTAQSFYLASGYKITLKDNIDLQNREGNTALHLALYKRLGQFSSHLIGSGASLDIRNINGHTPFDYWESNKFGTIPSLNMYLLKENIAFPFIRHKPMVYEPYNGDSTCKDIITKKCQKELEKIQKKKINENASLYILISQLQTPYYLRNEDLVKKVEKMLQKLSAFPLYEDILKGSFRYSKVRLPLLPLAMEVLDTLFITHVRRQDQQHLRQLPVLVKEHIFRYLNNTDLDSLIKSTRYST